MARVGRGRSRGGRLLDFSELALSNRGMGHGRIMTGRGITSIPPARLKEEPSAHLDPDTSQVKEKIEKKTLEDQLLEMQRTQKGSFIHMSLDYFENNDNVQYYTDKIMEHVLKCKVMVEKFAMNFRLITLLKSYGENIKLKMFSKLQSTFQDMLLLMKDSSSLSPVERETVRNFCELLGQLYFRFRPHLDSLERYNVLAAPAIECMSYLVQCRGHKELLVLVKLLFLNYSTLCELHEEKMHKLSLDIHLTIAKKTCDHTELMLLLCAVDIIMSQHGELPPYIKNLYAAELNSAWAEVKVTSPTRMLADIPPDIVQMRMDRFNVTVEEYTMHRFVDL